MPDLPDTEGWDPADRVDPKKFDLWTPARCAVCGKHLYYLVPVGAQPLCHEHADKEEQHGPLPGGDDPP